MANLRFRVLPRFPARLFAEGGMGIRKDGADWTVFPDWGTLSVLSSISDSANSEVWVRVTSAGVSTYFRMPLSSLISSLSQTGAGYSFVFTFDTTTTDADPGNGKLRLNQATQNTATVAYVDLADAGGLDITAILDSLTAGQFSLSKVGDSTKRLLGTLSTVTVAVGYRKLAISITGFSAASPFSNGDSVLFQYVKSGTGIVTGGTDNAVLRADGVGGATAQGSVVIIDDSGNMSAVVNLTRTGFDTFSEAAAPSTPAAAKVETYALADGLFQIKNDVGDTFTLAGVPRGHIHGLTVSNNAGDTTNDIDIAVGVAIDDTFARPITLASALTKRTDANWVVGTNQGGLDTGTVGNNTYHIWLIRRSDTGVVDILFSLSASAPTMPTSYDQKRRIFSIIRTGGAIKPFRQDGDDVFWVTRVTDRSSTAAVAWGLLAVTVPLGINVRPYFTGVYTQAAAAAGNNVIAIGDAADTGDTCEVNLLSSQFGDERSAYHSPAEVLTNTSAQINFRATATATISTSDFFTRGYRDRRGRDS